MLIPDRVVMDQVDVLAKEVMLFSRDTLAVKMRFINPALSRLELTPARWALATDGERLLYDPGYILHSYAREKNMPVRSYLHVVLHCVFQHFFVSKNINHELWNIATDIAVENMITELGLECNTVKREEKQQAAVENLKKEVGQLTAEKIYHYLLRHSLKEDDKQRLYRLFLTDDHEAWYIHSVDRELSSMGERTAAEESSDSDKTDKINDNADDPEEYDRMSRKKKQLQQQWQQIAEQIALEMEMTAQKYGEHAAGLVQNLAEVNREKYDYVQFLKKFASLGEVMQTDDDEFDYIFYTYGLELYQNVPLIEPLEYKAVKRIKEFVIAIDTSGSVSGEAVQNFVQKTYNILLQQENYFMKINLHLILCDAAVQADIKITKREELEKAIMNLEIKGGGGTDFRPVFRHVDRLIQDKEFSNLKGVLYFTDGEGVYPEKQPTYRTAFVFVRDDYQVPEVPVWAIKLILPKYELES